MPGTREGAPAEHGFSRRALLLGGGAVAAGAVVGGGAEAYAQARVREAVARERAQADTANALVTQTFHGVHQPGIEMTPQAHQTLVALDLHDDVDRAALRRMLPIISDDAARLMAGRSALADSEPELAIMPTGLTITVGFGRELIARVDPALVPAWLAEQPRFAIDRLEDAWVGGDLVLQIAADDPLTVAHTRRMLLKDIRPFTTVRWEQAGFRRAWGSQRTGTTQRNLFGQVDGTVNPEPGGDDFRRVVWDGTTEDRNPAWLAGGTGFIVRRFRMLLDKWDLLDREGREEAVGRRLDTGAPLTGTAEHDEPDFDAVTPLGFPVIAEYAHMRRLRSPDTAQRILRRTYNFEQAPRSADELSDSGLIFTAFQHDVGTQYVPLQQRMSDLDLLNEWVEHIGMAVFAIPPGCDEGGYVGQTLLEG